MALIALAESLDVLLKGFMKKLCIVIFSALVFAACNNGNRDYNMDTNVASPAGYDDSTAPTVFDTSASG
ncbi:MAG TPA: hypothetical protein VGD33_08645, partial [Chitinophagaceae bacterium]